MEFNAWLVANGFNPEHVTEAQRIALQAAWRASLNPSPATPAANSGAPAATQPAAPGAAAQTPAPAPAAATPAAGRSADELGDIVAAAQRENERRTAITQLIARHLQESPDRVAELERVGRLALDGRWDLQRTELELLRHGRGAGPVVYSPSQPEMSEEVVAAALCRAGGLRSIEKEFNGRTLEALDRGPYKRGMGLHQVIGLAARQRGWRGDSVKSDLRTAIRAANYRANEFGTDRMAAVGPSTYSLSGILSNVANKSLKENFLFVEQAWREVTAVRSVSDFKEITSYSLTGDATYDRVAPGGELKHAKLGEETYGNKADTYGKFFGVDRRDLINDDLGAFFGVTKRLGRGGALKLNDVFWAEFLANAAAFWTAGRGNYDDGTDTAFDAAGAGLKAADAIWQSKTDPDGKPLGVMAKILLVPPAHRITALNLMQSQNLIGGTAANPQQNPWAGMFRVVMSTYLANASFAGYSLLAWYLLADPNDLPVIETVFLDGQEMPTVESVELDADRLGMGMRAWHDFGARKQEYRAGLKLKGES